MQFRARLILLLALALSPARAAVRTPISGPPVDVPALLQNLINRAQNVATNTNLPVATFRKTSVSDTLAPDGSIKHTKEKLYEVTILRGMTHNRLVAVDGRKLDPAESDALTEKERRWRETYSTNRVEGSSGTERMDQLVNAKLLGRYQFTATGREIIHGRSCVILDFQPKPGDLPDERLIDRVLNLLRGRLWIDEEEHEVARADATTVGTLKVWGGLLGSLEHFELHVDRDRSPPGIWYNRHAEIGLRARRLLSPVLIRVREIGTDLRPVEEPGPRPRTVP